MPTCAIYGCDNRTETVRGRNITLHGFPKDKNICREWVRACKRRDKFAVTSYRICSIHFDETDYERDLQAELLNIERKKKLKQTAVPHLNLPSNVKEDDELLPPPQKMRKTLNSSRTSVQEAAEIQAVVERQKIVAEALNDVTCPEEVNANTDTPDSSDVLVDYKTLYFEREKELELLREQLKLYEIELESECLKS